MRTVTWTLVILLSATAMAQPKAYIDLEDGFWGTNHRLVIDGKDYRPGFTGFSDLQTAYASDPVAVSLIQKYEAYGMWANLFFWGTIAGLIAYSAKDEDDQSDNT